MAVDYQHIFLYWVELWLSTGGAGGGREGGREGDRNKQIQREYDGSGHFMVDTSVTTEHSKTQGI